ncbi:unnamed protein product [Rhizoctonia solani]|uniref:Carboxylic ester hydrolase n=1 Tax=Rhizoctonia solani TaxID=456999 RepID=A0A8H3H7L2_9AGAM|nr:unnamed protein product [Rhizoctonia solani]
MLSTHTTVTRDLGTTRPSFCRGFIYSPSLGATKKKLPVLVWIHGGGYRTLFSDAASYDPTPLIQASNISLVAVVIQYRLGMFGFLPGREVKQNGVLNAGLLDIQFALKWTQENVHLFGGDPDQVTIWGESAGAGAVLMQAVAEGGRTHPVLFKRAVASSPYLPAAYGYDDVESQLQYASFINNTRSVKRIYPLWSLFLIIICPRYSCTNATDTLGCLRGLDHVTLAEMNTQTPRFVVDGTLLTQRPQLLLEQGLVNGEQLISLHNANEGQIFISQDTNSTIQSLIVGFFPRLSQQNITAVEDVYRDFASDNASEADNTYKMQTMVLAESIFVCPSFWLADAFPKTSYKGQFAVPPAVHGLDLSVYFPDIGYPIALPVQPISRSLTQSFMGSPNNNPMNQSINPDWAKYDPVNPKEMIFNVTESGVADPEVEKVDSGLRHRCSLWGALAPFTQQ